MSTQNQSNGAVGVQAQRYSKSVMSAGGPRTDSETEAAHDRSFGNLMELVEKKFGVPGDEIPYWDPYGHLVGKDVGPVDLRHNLYKHWEPVFEEINETLREDRNANIGYAAEKAIEKQLGRSSFSIPIYFTPDVKVTSREQTPAADMMPRVMVNEDTIKVDEETDVGQAGSFDGEAGGVWPENDDDYVKHEYNIDSYGRQNAVSDFLQLATQGLRSQRAVTEEAQVASIRQYEERQILTGNGSAGLAASNDANGFPGLPDNVADPDTQINDTTGASMTIKRVKGANTYLKKVAKADTGSIVHFTDHETIEDLKLDLTDYLRYESPGDALDFGFESVMVDNTPVVETHGLPDSDNSRWFVSVDMSSNYMGMLQDATLHPLARDAPEESFAVDAYGALVSESTKGAHIYYGLN